MTVYRRNPLLMTVMGANPGPRTRKTAEKALDAAISGAWHRLMSGVQVPIMDIPRIFRDVKLEMAAGVPLEQAVTSVGTRYRVNRNPFGEAIIGGVAGALVNRALQPNPGPSFVVIDATTGVVGYTKRATGMGSEAIRSCVERARIFADRTGRPQIVFLDMQGVRVGMSVNVGVVRMLGITEEIFPKDRGQSPRARLNPHHEGDPCAMCGGQVGYLGTLGQVKHYQCRNCGTETRGPDPSVHVIRRIRTSRRRPPTRPMRNPAIARSWDSLRSRPRLAILEFAGIPYEQARRLAGRPWGTLPPDIRDEISKGWQENPRHVRRVRFGQRAGGRLARNAQPNPTSKRKMTMTVERFASWVKSKRDPAMWKAFLAKFRGYEKWTHGAKARKVTVEWVDTPGVNGLWITYDGGKQPESTYIMPKGSPRKGAWKHPWDTMPDIKHDPEAKIVITKLRGSSKITDFYHK